jgi:hypothetical protein
MTLRSGILRLVAGIAITALAVLVQAEPSGADPSPFDTLLGSWGGSGQIRLDKGRMERIKCNAYYTGGGAELGLAIRCQSDNYKIEIRSKLSYSGGRLSGNWEERTFNAQGLGYGHAQQNLARDQRRGYRHHGRQLHQVASDRGDLNARSGSPGREHYPRAELILPFASDLESGLAFLEDEVSMAD